MPFDVGRAVATAGSANQQIGLADAATGCVDEPPVEDDRCAVAHRRERRHLSLVTATFDRDRLRCAEQNLRDADDFERVAVVEKPLLKCTGLNANARHQQVVLRANGTLLRDVPALKRDSRRVVPSGHLRGKYICVGTATLRSKSAGPGRSRPLWIRPLTDGHSGVTDDLHRATAATAPYRASA